MFHHKIVSSAIILKISLNRHSSKLFFMVKPPVYALEGSVAVAGTGLSWLRSNLGVVNEIKEVEELAAKVEDTGDVYFVPAFSGLFAPYWRWFYFFFEFQISKPMNDWFFKTHIYFIGQKITNDSQIKRKLLFLITLLFLDLMLVGLFVVWPSLVVENISVEPFSKLFAFKRGNPSLSYSKHFNFNV